MKSRSDYLRISIAVIFLFLLCVTASAQSADLPGFRMAALLKPNASAPGSQQRIIVARIWHGRTLTAKADEYYEYLKEAGIKKIEAIQGNLGAQVLRRTQGENTEFVVITYWESREAIKKFAGNDIEKANSLPRDREFLLEIEPTVRHFDVLLDDRK